MLFRSHVGLVDAFPEPAFETVGIEKPHEKLKIGLLAVVRRRRHEQKIPGPGPEKLAKLVALEPIALDEGIAGDGGFNLIAGEQVEAEGEFADQLFLQLLHEIARRHNQATFEVAAD